MIFLSGVWHFGFACYRSDSDLNMQDLHVKLIYFTVEIGVRSFPCFAIYLSIYLFIDIRR